MAKGLGASWQPIRGSVLDHGYTTDKVAGKRTVAAGFSGGRGDRVEPIRKPKARVERVDEHSGGR